MKYVLSLIVFPVFYGAVAFVILEPNPLNWTFDGRLFFTIFATILYCGAVTYPGWDR